ncbi:MAG: acetyltransferase [Flavobacteriales bacterium]|nr:acetyltransferase [Flavobacteriales bacterium]
MNLLIAGAGGQAKGLLGVFRYENYIREVSLFDNISDNLPDKLFGEYKILTTDQEVKDLFERGSRLFVVAISSPEERRKMTEKLLSLGGINMSYLSSKSLISRHNNISEEGVIINASCEISSDVTIGRGVLLGVKVLIGHDATIGEFTTLGPKVKVLGYATIGNNCVIGTGVTIMPKVKIGDNVTIGINVMVRKSVPDNTIIE